jgi:hypothetical protein
MLLLPTPAVAQGGGYGGDGGGREGPQGNAEGGNILASVTTTGVRLNGNTGNGDRGNLAPVGGNWTPPVSWYEPVATPSQLAGMVEELENSGDLAPVTPSLSWYHGLFRQYYEDGETTGSGGGGYENFNLDLEGEGMWWRGTINPLRAGEYGLDDARCDELMFWADSTEAPGVENALTPEILAGYAYDAMAVPETKFELNPEGTQVVELDTWIWGQGDTFRPVTVRATLPGTGLWAETTARPVSFSIDPGTADAIVHPSGNACRSARTAR